MTERRRFGAVIVNYNSAPFALDAALSVLGAAPGDARVVIVDNASPDDSLDYFQSALSGSRHVPAAPAGPVPVAFANPESVSTVFAGEGATAAANIDLTIINAAENRGFAAGCNIGLKALHTSDPCGVYLLLNPDALVAATTLEAFASRLSEDDAGLCGATILRYEAPHLVQAFGGAALNPMTLLGDNLGEGNTLEDAPATEVVEDAMDYPLGAAIALRADYLETIGFLDERYFLYYEEADWALAGRKAGRPSWARDAVVYHRYGASSGSNVATVGRASERSPVSDYHMARSRLLFALKWRPTLAFLLVTLGALQALRRLLRGRFKQARAVALGSLPGARRQFSAR